MTSLIDAVVHEERARMLMIFMNWLQSRYGKGNYLEFLRVADKVEKNFPGHKQSIAFVAEGFIREFENDEKFAEDIKVLKSMRSTRLISP